MKTPTLTFEFLNQPAASSQKIDLRIDKKEFQILTEDGSCIIDEVEFVKIIDLETKKPLPVVAAPQPTTTATPRKGMSKFLSRILNRLSVLPLTLPLCLVLVMGVGNVWGQSPTNGGFEDGTTNWTTAGSAGTTNARTGTNALAHTTSSTSSNVAHTNSSTISVSNNNYAHVIGWAIGSNANSRASCGGTLNGSASSTGIVTIGTTLTRLTHVSAQNTTGSAVNFSCRVNTRSNSGSTTVYWDDVIIYTSSSSTTDITDPTAATSFTNGSITSSSVAFSWTNGSDAATGIQNTIILRTTNTSAATPSLNDQGVYSVAGGTSGPNTIGDWTVISVSVASGTTSYTDNTVAAGTSYKYVVIHRDLAYNYSTALVSATITTSSPTPSITLADNGSQVSASSVAAGSTNVILHQSSLAVTTANATLTGVSFTTTGTYAAADVSNFKVWYSADNSFATTGDNTQLGSTITTSLEAGAKSVSSLNQAINSGSTGYIFITTDIVASPTGGNTINVSALTTSDVTFSSGTKSGSTTAGGAKTLQAASSPTLNAVTLSSSLTSTYGTASTGVSFTASGSNLTGNITATAQSGYEVSTSLGSGYGASVSVASGTTVYVRFASTISAGDKNNATAVVLSGGGASSNANVTTSSSGNTVSQKALTVTGLTAQSKVYDGLTSTTATGTAALSGVVGADAVSLSGTPTFTFVNATVGNSKTVNTTNYSLTGAQAGNYTLTQPTLSANITARALTITANNVNKIVGNTLTGGAGSTAFTSSGLQNSETIGSVNILYGTGAASGDAVGTYASQVTPSAATGGTFTAGNYSISYVAGSITVLEAPIIIGGWDFNGLTNGGSSPLSATTSNSNLTIGGLTRGSALGVSSAAANAWGTNVPSQTPTDAASAITNNSFITFTVKSNSGSTVSISGIDAYNVRRSITGYTTGQWQYSIDGTSYTNIGGSISWGSTTTSSGNSQTAIDLNSISALQNLTSATTVTFRIALWGASGASGSWYLNDPSASSGNDFVIQGYVKTAPQLSTPTATSITTNSATLGATITSDGGATITSRGTVYKTSSPVLSSDNASAEGGTSTGAFTQSRSSLSPQTRYFYAGYAVNSIGTGLSAEGNFRTLSNPPSSQATGLSATSISSTQIDLSIASAATFPGSGATQGGYLVIYSSSGSPTLASTNGQAPSAGVGSIFSTNATNLPSTPSTSISVTGLSSSNTYNFLVIPYTWDGINAATYNYLTTSAPTSNATTSAGTPTLNSPTVSNITATSATLGATVTSNGGSSLTARGTVFKTSSPVLSTDNALSEGGTTVSSYSHTRSSLSPQTLYYFAGYASNNEGTGLSSEGSFRTLSNPPSAQASSLNALASSSSQIDLTFTGATFPGSGATQAGYVVIYATGTPTFTASNGQVPAAGVGTIFTTSATILPSNPSTTVNITGLSATTNYNFLIVPYSWDGTNATTYHYLTTAAITASATTLNPTAGLQLNASNTAFVIDFDNTVSGVNSGQFSAPANWASTSPTSGMLNSNAWAYSSTVGTGAATFGSSLSAGLGQSNGTVTSVGPYSFQVSTGNRAWGIQPTGSDWTPGHLTLRIQNQTGSSLNSISLSYKIWVLNNDGRSNSFNFSHSSDNSTYAAVSTLNLSSTAAAEGTPTWKSYTRVVSISGLNIPNSGYYYLRWTGDDVSGSGSRDEFALDDITVIANPSTTYHSLSGTSQELVIDGNTSLGGNITISGTTSLTSGTLTVGANTLTINGAISLGSGNIDASNASATVVFGGSTAQTIPAATFTGNINNLTLNNSAGLTTNQPLTVNGNLTLTSGDLTIGATNLTLGSASAISSASASSHIVTTSTGEVRKIYGGNGSFTFPVGDGTNYTPATINFTTGSSLSGAADDYVGVRLKTTKVTGMNSGNNNYINRSWFIEPGAGLSSYSYTVNLTYAQGDVVGTESEIRPVKLSSGVWQYPGNANFDFGTQLANTLAEINEITNVLSWSGLTSFSEFGGGGQGGPLPVELLSFNATCENDQIVLNWQTASEHNSLYFDIEKSRDGQSWSVIGQQIAAGNSNELLSYQFVDAEKNNATVYYRLNQVDIDGKNEYFGPIAVVCEPSQFDASTSPNPSENLFYLIIESEDEKFASFVMKDLNGNMVKSKNLELEKGNNMFLIDEKFPTGIYFMEITTEKGLSKILKHFNF